MDKDSKRPDNENPDWYTEDLAKTLAPEDREATTLESKVIDMIVSHHLKELVASGPDTIPVLRTILENTIQKNYGINPYRPLFLFVLEVLARKGETVLDEYPRIINWEDYGVEDMLLRIGGDKAMTMLLEIARKASDNMWREPYARVFYIRTYYKALDALNQIINSRVAALIFTTFENISPENGSEITGEICAIETIAGAEKLLDIDKLVKLAEKKFAEKAKIALDTRENLAMRQKAIGYLGFTRDERVAGILYECYQTPIIKGYCETPDCLNGSHYYSDWQRKIRPSLAVRTGKQTYDNEEETWETFVQAITEALWRIGNIELLERIATDENENRYVHCLAIENLEKMGARKALEKIAAGDNGVDIINSVIYKKYF